MIESSPNTERIEGESKKYVIASAIVLFFASAAVFQFSLTNQLSIANVISFTDETRRLQTSSTPHGLGEFYVTMFVGEPPQIQRLQVTTSVDYTAMFCPDCYHCGSSHFDNAFNPYASSTAQFAQCGSCLDPEARCMQTTNQCLLTSHFLGSLASAVEVSEQVLIDYTSTTISETTPPTTIGHGGLGLKFQCVNFLDSQAELTKSVADGYLSMSPAKTSFFQQLFDTGGIERRIFSLCFRDSLDKFQPAGASAGTILLGAIMNANQFQTPLVYARNSAIQVDGTPSGYFINVRRIYLAIGAQSDTLMRISQSALSLLPIENAAGQSMDVYAHVNGASGSVEVDMNKPYTLLHRDLMEPFTASFLNVTGLHYDRNGIPVTSTQFKQLPTIVLQLESSDGANNGGFILVGVPGLIGELDPVHPMDVLVAIPPQHYIIYDATKGIATPTVIFDTTVSFIGSNVLQGHQIVYDLDQVRIGFAEQDCAAGLSLVIADSGAHSEMLSSHTLGNYTRLESNSTSSHAPGEVVSVSSGTIGSAKSSSGGHEFSGGGASTQGTAGTPVSSTEAGSQVLSSIAGSTSGVGSTVVTTGGTSTTGNSVTHIGLPKASNTENQSMRYGPAVTTPYSYNRVQAQTSTTAPSSHPKTGGSNLLWYLMAGAAFLMGFGLTVAGTRPENAAHASPQWGRGGARADDGLSVLDGNATTVYGGGGRKQVYGGGNKSVMGGNKSVMGGRSVMGNKSVMGGNKSVMGGNKSVVPTTTKQVYEGPKNTKQVYEGPSTTKQVYEGPTNTKQVYEGSSSEHAKSITTSKESQHSLFSKGFFGGGKKPKEAPANDGGTVTTGWSQNSGSLFTRAQSAAGSPNKNRKGMSGKVAKADDAATAFTYGTQSYYGHNVD